MIRLDILRLLIPSGRRLIKKAKAIISTITSVNMKCIFLKLTAFAMLATASASGVYASSESDEPSSTTPQSLRGSFLDENEDADWWRGRGSQGGGDMSTCTTNCQCSQGKIPLWNWNCLNSPCGLAFLLSNVLLLLEILANFVSSQVVAVCLNVRATANVQGVRLLSLKLFSP